MNRIFAKNIQSVVADYQAHVLPAVSQRLSFVIGISAIRQGKLTPTDLNKDAFFLNGQRYEIGNEPKSKKRFTNTVLNGKNQVKIVKGQINFDALQDKDCYRRGYKTFLADHQRYSYIEKNLDKIIVSPLSSLKSEIAYLETKFKNISKQETKILNLIFNYPKYFHKSNGGPSFYALKLAQELDTPVCPYCNREYITSIKDIRGQKITGPTFDHFLSHADYPFLAISFYNLIPSCYTCNSQLKFQIPFDLQNFLHPYFESYENIARFRVFQRKQELKSELSNYNDLELKIEPLIKPTDVIYSKLFGPVPNPTKFKKGSLNVFNTELIYNKGHINEAVDLLAKFKEIPKKHTSNLLNTLIKGQGKTEADVYRFYFGNYFNEEDFNRRPLARLTRDLTKQLSAIYGYGYFK